MLSQLTKNALGQLIARFRGGGDVVLNEYYQVVIGGVTAVVPVSNSYVDVAGYAIPTPAGIWLVSYSGKITVPNLGSGDARVALRDAANAVHVIREFQETVNATAQHNVAFSVPVRVPVATTLKLSFYLEGGVPSGVNFGSGGSDSYFNIVRIGA